VRRWARWTSSSTSCAPAPRRARAAEGERPYTYADDMLVGVIFQGELARAYLGVTSSD
jgi:hypothetical protein